MYKYICVCGNVSRLKTSHKKHKEFANSNNFEMTQQPRKPGANWSLEVEFKNEKHFLFFKLWHDC